MGGHHEALLRRVQVKALGDGDVRRSEQHPGHGAEVEIQDLGEEGRGSPVFRKVLGIMARSSDGLRTQASKPLIGDRIRAVVFTSFNVVAQPMRVDARQGRPPPRLIKIKESESLRLPVVRASGASPAQAAGSLANRSGRQMSAERPATAPPARVPSAASPRGSGPRGPCPAAPPCASFPATQGDAKERRVARVGRHLLAGSSCSTP
jgi:hypothetical protein